MAAPTAELLSKLHAVKSISGGYSARCPAHEDHIASLSVSEGDDGRVLLHCHAGCPTDAIVDAIGLSLKDLFPRPEVSQKSRIVAAYDYRDENGQLLFQTVRSFPPKKFKQRQPTASGGWVWSVRGVRMVLYRLPELRGQAGVYIVEGEKDVNTLVALGVPATTSPRGSSQWKHAYIEQLQWAGIGRVVVLPDNDEPGEEYAAAIVTSCLKTGLPVKVVRLPGLAEKEDVSDWLAEGNTKDDLFALVKQTPPETAAPPPKAVRVIETANAASANRSHLTDLGAAEYFASCHADHVRFDKNRNRWLVWEGHRWVPDADAIVHRMMTAHLRKWQRDAQSITDRRRRQEVADFALKLERKGALQNVLDMASKEKPIHVVGREWDRNGWLLGVQNGVVDLKTGRHRAGSPDDQITMSTNCTYEEGAQASEWACFLLSVLPDPEVRVFLQRFIGYTLTGCTDEQVLAILYGKGSNGKALALGTPIPTPTGWSTQGDVRVGDEVFDDAGQVCRVVGLSPIWSDRPCYRMTFSDGSTIVADAEHEWAVRGWRGPRGHKTSGMRQSRVTTEQIASSLITRTRTQLLGGTACRITERRWHVPAAKPLVCSPARLPVDPYILGLWLGDGASANARISCGDDDVSHVMAKVEQAGYYARPHRDSDGVNWLVKVSTNPVNRPGRGHDSLAARLRRMSVLNNKHVPPIYLRASAGQRLSLLQGLMDSDGSTLASQAQCEFTNTNERLAESVAELLRSLGMNPTVRQSVATLHGRIIGPKWRVIFTSVPGTDVFTLPRKLASCRPRKSPVVRGIVKCERVPSVPVRCIQVSSESHLYLAGQSMIPTHNSTLLSVLVEVLGDYARTIAFSALEMKRSDIPSDIAALEHARLVMASEVKEGQRFNEGRIKSLTGGDVISARHLYGEWFNFKPEAKFFLAVNHKPAVADDSYGFWRRIRLVPFLQSFQGAARIPDLQQRLLEERNGILQWAIQGCLDWQRDGLTLPDAVTQASNEYQSESDPLAEFIDECCETDPNAEVKAGIAFATYAKWCDARRLPRDSVLRPQAFGLRFSDKFDRSRRSYGNVYAGVRISADRLF